MATFWDHLNNITYDKGPYLGDDNWNIYMINRYLSMDPDYCELINVMQKNLRFNSQIPNEVMYNAYRNIIPKRKVYLKYIKSENKKKYDEIQLKSVATYFEISQRDAKDYIDLMDKKDIKDIVQQIHGK